MSEANRHIFDEETEIYREAGQKRSWKCKRCHKLSQGFVLPFGRCFMCGGELEPIEPYTGKNAAKLAVIREAAGFELSMHSFYLMAHDRATDPKLRVVLGEMAEKEREHLDELNAKYHLELPTTLGEMPAGEGFLSWLFEGINFDDAKGQADAVYVQAIQMEKRTRDYFKKRALECEGEERAFYEELAAEEAEHVELLEAERASL